MPGPLDRRDPPRSLTVPGDSAHPPASGIRQIVRGPSTTLPRSVVTAPARPVALEVPIWAGDESPARHLWSWGGMA